MARVCAIIVAYKPNRVALEALIQEISSQVYGVVIVDNGGDLKSWGDLSSKSDAKLHKLISLDTNIGLAAAQNKGINYAFDLDFTHVILLDQDSLPGVDMVRNLLRVEKELVEAGVKVAAVGPQAIDHRTLEKFPFCQVGMLRTRKIISPESVGQEYCKADFLISSGSLIRRIVWGVVGGLDEGLFIANLDVDWCYRAKYKGYRCFGVFSAKLGHCLGDKVVHLFFGRLTLHIHTPDRLYFIMRNRVLLYKRKEIPLSWKSNDFPRLIAKLVLFSICISPHLENTRSMLTGIKDGFLGDIHIRPTRL